MLTLKMGLKLISRCHPTVKGVTGIFFPSIIASVGKNIDTENKKNIDIPPGKVFVKSICRPITRGKDANFVASVDQ